MFEDGCDTWLRLSDKLLASKASASRSRLAALATSCRLCSRVLSRLMTLMLASWTPCEGWETEKKEDKTRSVSDMRFK